MAHRAKYKTADALKILGHDCREEGKESKQQFPELTHLNYDMMEEYRNGKSAQERLQERLNLYSEIFKEKWGRKLRSDVVAMCSWIVTAPKDLPEEEHDRFFELTFDFMMEKYGLENMIAATVHKDEAGEHHCHFCYMPVVPDVKFKDHWNPDFRYKLCQKNSEMGTLDKTQEELQKYLKEKMGHDVAILNGETKRQGGNKTVKEMKKETARAYAAALKHEEDTKFIYEVAKAVKEINEEKLQETQEILNKLNDELQAKQVRDDYLQTAIKYYQEHEEPTKPTEPSKPKIHYGKVWQKYQEELKNYENKLQEYHENVKLYQTGKQFIIDESLEQAKHEYHDKTQQLQSEIQRYEKARKTINDEMEQVQQAHETVKRKEKSVAEREQQIPQQAQRLAEQMFQERLKNDEQYNDMIQHRADLIAFAEGQADSFMLLQHQQNTSRYRAVQGLRERGI